MVLHGKVLILLSVIVTYFFLKKKKKWQNDFYLDLEEHLHICEILKEKNSFSCQVFIQGEWTPKFQFLKWGSLCNQVEQRKADHS